MSQHHNDTFLPFAPLLHLFRILKDHTFHHLLIPDTVVTDNLHHHIRKMVVELLLYTDYLCFALVGERQRQIVSDYTAAVTDHIVHQRIYNVVAQSV